MKEIKINKSKAWKKKLISLCIENGIWALVFFLIILTIEFAFSLDSTWLYWMNYSYLLVGINFIWGIIRNWLWFNSIKYYYSSDKLIEECKIITKTINSARLQVVNSVDIEQGIIDKFFNFFNVVIDYGFGESGYTFEFNYLDEETANKIANEIKATGLSLEENK